MLAIQLIMNVNEAEILGNAPQLDIIILFTQA